MDSLALPEWIVLLAALMALGGVAGFLAGLLGIGGGAILVPGLFYIFTAPGFEDTALMHMAVGTSLAVIVPTGLVSARAHMKRGAVDFDLVRQIGPGIIAGALAGTVLADHLAGETLKIIFAAAIIFLAMLMVYDPSRLFNFERGLHQPFAASAGGVIGLISTLIGIGGATLSVPWMSMNKVAIHRAIGTAAALGLVIAVPAAIGFVVIGWGEAGRPPFSLGYVSAPAWAAIVLVSALAAPLGAATAHNVPVDLMRKGFAMFMVVVATVMAAEVL